MLGVAVIADDILVYGRTPQEHNENLIRVVDKCRNAGIKLKTLMNKLESKKKNILDMSSQPMD